MLTSETYTPACDPPDEFDCAVQGLLEVLAMDGMYAFQQVVDKAWSSCVTHKYGCLFGFCEPKLRSSDPASGYGCLTQVRAGLCRAFTDKLTDEIRVDSRIPNSPTEITPDSLLAFAEWQRRMKEEFTEPIKEMNIILGPPCD